MVYLNNSIQVEIYHSGGKPSICSVCLSVAALQGQCYSWLAQHQYAVTRWDSKFIVTMTNHKRNTSLLLWRHNLPYKVYIQPQCYRVYLLYRPVVIALLSLLLLLRVCFALFHLYCFFVCLFVFWTVIDEDGCRAGRGKSKLGHSRTISPASGHLR